MRLSVRHALLPHGLAANVVIETDGATLTEVRPASAGDPPPERGLLLPGLVNAHLHLELGWAAGKVPGGEGLGAWIGRMMALPRPEYRYDARPLVDAGTALVCDISNAGDTASALDSAGIAGIVQHELLGLRREVLADRLATAALPDRAVGRMVVRPSPHATYSTPPELIRAACRPSAFPASIHLSEDPAESLFTREGTGPIAEALDQRGIDWRWWVPPGLSPARYLDALGVLGPSLLLVHGVHLDDDDRKLIASRRCPLCLCPRSNLHIGGRLPDVPALLAEGIRCCLGTDSLASSPDLDVLAEIPVLARAWPEIPLERWLSMATIAGADALGFPRYGRIAVGAAPGLLWLGVDHPQDLLEGSFVPRKMVVPP